MQPLILQLLGQNNSSQAATQLSPTAQKLGQLRQMIGTIRNAGDPQALLQQMMQQRNPGLAKAMDYVKQHGNDPKAAFESLAKEQGINPADLGL